MNSRARSFNFNVGAATRQQATTVAPGKCVTTTTASQAVLSINVNQKMAPSFENQCMIDQLQAKKRRAFENLTNAATGSQNAQACAQASNNSTANKDNSSKKSKISVATNAVFGAASKAKKNDSTKKPSALKKVPSKENLTSLLPTRKASTASVDAKCQPQVPAKPVLNNATNKPVLDTLKLTKSAQSALPMAAKNTNAQILEPQIRYADSTESLISSTGSFSMSDSSVAHNSSLRLQEAIKARAEAVEGWEDIDAGDHGDEFACSDYAVHIFKHYREREDHFVVDDYLKRQTNINKHMRLLLVDWMVEVQQQLEFNHEVLYLSVKLLDLYLNKRRIEKEKLQLLGGAAMFIACKFEERMPPIIEDFIYVSDNAYDRNELIKMEIDILKTVKFDIGIPLSYTFLRRYSKCVKADMRFLTLARYILELSLQDYQFAPERDSLKACAALYLALKMTVAYEKNVQTLTASHSETMPAENLIVSSANLTSTEWNATLIHYTGSFVSDFAHLLIDMNNLIKTAHLSKYKTIFKKYSHQVFYEVAKIAPLSDSEINSLVQNADQK